MGKLTLLPAKCVRLASPWRIFFMLNACPFLSRLFVFVYSFGDSFFFFLLFGRFPWKSISELISPQGNACTLSIKANR